MRFYLRGAVKIYPTEDLEKVKASVERMFSGPTFNIISENGSKILTFESESLKSLHKMKEVVKRDWIRDAVRKALKERIEGKKIRFFLNKQVAYVGHVSICEPEGESPLGPIEVEVECENPLQLIDWLSPSSRLTE